MKKMMAIIAAAVLAGCAGGISIPKWELVAMPQGLEFGMTEEQVAEVAEFNGAYSILNTGKIRQGFITLSDGKTRQRCWFMFGTDGGLLGLNCRVLKKKERFMHEQFRNARNALYSAYGKPILDEDDAAHFETEGVIFGIRKRIIGEKFIFAIGWAQPEAAEVILAKVE